MSALPENTVHVSGFSEERLKLKHPGTKGTSDSDAGETDSDKGRSGRGSMGGRKWWKIFCSG